MIVHTTSSTWWPLLAALFIHQPAPTELPADPGKDVERQRARSAAFPDGAPLHIDGELARSLERIDELLERDRTIDAIRSWQQLLDGMAGTGPLAGNTRLKSFSEEADWTVRTTGGEAYARHSSIRAYVEQRQRDLDAAGRADYLLETDAESDRLWEEFQRARSAAILEAIVARFFNGKRGDDAAVALASRSLERGDPVDALALLERVDVEHPDADVDERALLLRKVVATARSGDLEGARTLWENERPPRTPADVDGLVAREIERAEAPLPVRPSSWTSGAGNSHGNRLAPTLPPTAIDERITEAWSLPYAVRPIDVAPPEWRVGLPREGEPPRPFDAPFVVQAWEELRLPPAGHAVLADGRLYVRGSERVLCCDAATGRVRWMGRRTRFPTEQVLRNFATKRLQFGQIVRNPDEEEMVRFFDGVPVEFSVDEGILFAIEGHPFEEAEPESGKAANTYRRVRRNELAAYDAETGRHLWRRGADEADAPIDDVGFLGAPVVDRDLVLAPISIGGEIAVLGLDRETGETRWQTLLGDEPAGGCSPWSPVRIVLAGRRAYVLSGTGVVHSLDVGTGDLHWALRYRRSNLLELSPEDRNRQRATTYDFVGWERESLLISGRLLIVLASDADRLFAIDRRTGEVAWEAPAMPFREEGRATQLLGLVGRRIVVGGYDVLRGYDAETGLLEWQAPIEGVTGRGIVTPEAVLVPVGSAIEVRDPETGGPVRRLEFVSPFGKPLGNLASDGTRLYAAGVTRVCALEPLPRRMERLAERIDRGDPLAHIDRARLNAHLDGGDGAFEDILAAARLIEDPARDPAVTAAVLKAAGQLDVGRRHPQLVLAALTTGGLGRVPDLPDVSEPDVPLPRLWNTVAHDALVTMAHGDEADATREILAVAGRSRDPYVHDAARIALDRTVTPDDLPQLERAIRDDHPARTAAIFALGSERLGETEGIDDLLESLWIEGAAGDRLAVAETSLLRGNRGALERLVELLPADDVAIRSRAGRLLRIVTGENIGFDPRAAAPERMVAAEAWQRWVTEHGSEVDLAIAAIRPRPSRNRLLVASSQKGTVIEYDRNRNVVWQAPVPNAYGIWGTPEGRRIVATYTGKSLVVYEAGDGAPEVAWRRDDLPGRPYSVQGLPNGNVLVGFYDTGAVEEYDPEGKVVWKAGLQGSVADARRLDDGRTLVTWYGQNSVVELDRAGRIVGRFDDMNGPRCAQRLPDGNTLVAQYRRSRVIEVDPEGKLVWSHENVSGVQSAQRLPNGNTLVVHRTGIVEIRRDGSPVWELKGAGFRQLHAY